MQVISGKFFCLDGQTPVPCESSFTTTVHVQMKNDSSSAESFFLSLSGKR